MFLAIGSLVVALSGTGGPLGHPGTLITEARTAIADAVAGPQFSDAAYSLEQYRNLSGTYQGAAVMGRQITVRWATDKMYCVEGVSTSGAVEYLLGPNGHVALGSCPYVAF
jgi:hypothetical protein